MFKKKKKDVSLEIIIDSEFDGIIYESSDESSGCKLKGKLILKSKKSITIKSLTFLFIGRATVACGPPLSSSRPEYCEIEEILQRQCVFHQTEHSDKRISAGAHEYHFEYDLPGNLPPSFKGSRGKIEYSCHAILARPIFNNDVIVKKEVMIKRCMINETATIQPHQLSSFTESTLDEKIHYQINSPMISFREGGLVSMELSLKPLDSNISIEFIEYGIKEQIHYHTTGEHAMSVIASINEDRFPLGKKTISIDPNTDYDPNIIPINFRLCPWVNCDIESQLIDVSHKLSFTIGYKERVKDFTIVEAENVFDDDENTGQTHSNQRFSIPLKSTIDRSHPASNTTTKSKRVEFEIPLVITSKSNGKFPQAPSYSEVDEPPAYIYTTMIPPPPEYTARNHLPTIDEDNVGVLKNYDDIEYLRV
ncbi:12302_t:CDS:2 [Entrophospora sp. SA101]|nr:12302_t:CDS:2 [Entrophospora sp. SA101]